MDDQPLSKTRRKKDMHALQDLGASLLALTPTQLAGLDLPERLADALAEARRIAGFEARRRQMQYIGRLMRDVDPAPIAARIALLRNDRRQQNAHHHEAEHWRDRLLADDAALTELARIVPGLDTQQIHTLVRNARREQAQGRPPKAGRALFRAVRDSLAAIAPPAAAAAPETPPDPLG